MADARRWQYLLRGKFWTIAWCHLVQWMNINQWFQKLFMSCKRFFFKDENDSGFCSSVSWVYKEEYTLWKKLIFFCLLDDDCGRVSNSVFKSPFHKPLGSARVAGAAALQLGGQQFEPPQKYCGGIFFLN